MKPPACVRANMAPRLNDSTSSSYLMWKAPQPSTLSTSDDTLTTKPTTDKAPQHATSKEIITIPSATSDDEPVLVMNEAPPSVKQPVPVTIMPEDLPDEGNFTSFLIHINVYTLWIYLSFLDFKQLLFYFSNSVRYFSDHAIRWQHTCNGDSYSWGPSRHIRCGNRY